MPSLPKDNPGKTQQILNKKNLKILEILNKSESAIETIKHQRKSSDLFLYDLFSFKLREKKPQQKTPIQQQQVP